MAADWNRKVCEDLTYGLYLVTSLDGDRLNGQLINTAIQVTSDPPRLAVIINKKNLTHEFISKSRVYAVCVLEEAASLTFFGPFGFRSGREVDKFAKVPFKKGTTGCPLVTDYTLSVMEVKVLNEMDVGTHTIFVGDLVNGERLKEGRPLTYRYYRENLRGKTSANAPTYSPTP